MKELILYRWIAVLTVFVTIYFILGFASSFFGWYGYQKWKYRVGTNNMEDSKKRGVFVKELHFQVDSFTRDMSWFKPYLERGFKYGYNSEDETVPLTGSEYPYQIGLENNVPEGIYISIRDDQLIKFDSANTVRGYFRLPHIRDTIILIIDGENIHSGTIKIWE